MWISCELWFYHCRSCNLVPCCNLTVFQHAWTALETQYLERKRYIESSSAILRVTFTNQSLEIVFSIGEQRRGHALALPSPLIPSTARQVYRKVRILLNLISDIETLQMRAIIAWIKWINHQTMGCKRNRRQHHWNHWLRSKFFSYFKSLRSNHLVERLRIPINKTSILCSPRRMLFWNQIQKPHRWNQ